MSGELKSLKGAVIREQELARLKRQVPVAEAKSEEAFI